MNTPRVARCAHRPPQLTRGRPLAFRQVARSIIRFAPAGGAPIQNVVSFQHCARAVDCTSDGDVVPFIIAARERDLWTFDGNFKADIFQAVGIESRCSDKVSVCVGINDHGHRERRNIRMFRKKSA